MFLDDYLAEFDHEMDTTRRVLARVPDAHAEWRPHPKSTPLPFTTTAAMPDAFDANVRRSRTAIAATTDEQLSHSIHHRGQLSVHLRLLDVPVPSIYGPTADEAR